MAKTIGHAAVKYDSKALYLVMDGGTFKNGDIEGRFAADVSGSTLVIYMNGGGTYSCTAKHIIEAAVRHHKKLAKKGKKK